MNKTAQRQPERMRGRARERERESDLKYYSKDIADLFFRRKNVIIFNNNKQSRVYTIWIVRA